MVRKTAPPVAGALHRNQTELSAGWDGSPCEGSPTSAVAPMFRLLMELLALGRKAAADRLSFDGARAARLRTLGPLWPLTNAWWGRSWTGPLSAEAGTAATTPSDKTAAAVSGMRWSFTSFLFFGVESSGLWPRVVRCG